jgi:cytochrome c-type biogenesis protein CcmH
MSWVVAVALALAAFVAVTFVWRAPREGWATLGAALALGLAGYALQASPGLSGAPASAIARPALDGGELIEARRRILGVESVPSHLITADAFARRGQYEEAAGILRSVVGKHPRDAEAWLALGNALVEHGEGTLSPAALYAYRKAAEIAPDSAGPAFFLGLAMIRQGDLIDAHRLWSDQLGAMPADAPGREELATRFAMLDGAMRRLAEQAEQPAQPSPAPSGQ